MKLFMQYIHAYLQMSRKRAGRVLASWSQWLTGKMSGRCCDLGGDRKLDLYFWGTVLNLIKSKSKVNAWGGLEGLQGVSQLTLAVALGSWSTAVLKGTWEVVVMGCPLNIEWDQLQLLEQAMIAWLKGLLSALSTLLTVIPATPESRISPEPSTSSMGS